MTLPLETVADGIGGTPLVKIDNLAKNVEGTIYGKLEYKNPAGSVKDRIAYNMIKQAEDEGEIEPGMTIIEPTSGNTGIGLALMGAVFNYDIVVTLPEGTSAERKSLLQAYGATVHSTPLEEGMRGAIDLADELIEKNDDYYMLGQFENPANPEIHRQTTGPEIYEDLDGELDAFVTGVGTGGTITGTGQYLKGQDPSIDVVAVEPENSAVLSGDDPGQHVIQGIGAGFVPDILDVDLLDDVITVQDQRALDRKEDLGHNAGILVGVSAGANVQGSIHYLKKNPGSTVVTTLCDTGERYLSDVR